MRPLAVVTGVIMASSGAIALGLAVVVLIYWIIGTEAPAVRREIPTLLTNSALFAGFTVISVTAFHAQLMRRAWRHLALAAMVAALAGLVVYYLP